VLLLVLVLVFVAVIVIQVGTSGKYPKYLTGLVCLFENKHAKPLKLLIFGLVKWSVSTKKS
jgi:hypothetical protein